MNSEHVAVISAVGAGAGAVISQKGILPYVSGSGIIPAVFGLAVAGLGFFVLKTDAVSEALVGVGIGWTINALI